MERLLTRKVGQTGRPPSPIIHIPIAFAQLEGIRPGDDVNIGYDGGILVIVKPSRAGAALRLLEAVRAGPAEPEGGQP